MKNYILFFNFWGYNGSILAGHGPKAKLLIQVNKLG